MDRIIVAGDNEPDLSCFGDIRLIDILTSEDEIDKKPDVMMEHDFPIEFTVLLHKLLLSKNCCVVVLSATTKAPVGIISVKDVWNYVMQGANLVGS
jgi:hypothetical protein